MGEVTRYSQSEQAWRFSEQRVYSEKQLAQGFKVADIHLNRTYLDTFSAAPILEAESHIIDRTKIRMIEISKLVYDAGENFIDKLMSVYSALYSLQSSVAVILDSDGYKIRFFLGIRSEGNAAIAGDILESALKGNFPGIVYNSLDASSTQNIMKTIRDQRGKGLASVSIVPSVRGNARDTEAFVQGIEKLIDTMSGKTYTMICLASPLSLQEIQQRKHGYEELCSALSPHSKTTMTYGENESMAINHSLSSSFSESVNRSVSNSNSHSTSNSRGSNYSNSSGDSYNFNFDGFGWGSNSAYSSGSFESYTSGNSFTEAFTDSEGTSSSETSTKGETKTNGSSKTISINYENRGVENLIERAQAQLERFKICESFGMWDFSSYFMSKDIHTVAMSGNVYKALMTGKESNVESAHFNIWSLNQSRSISKILDYVLNFKHPLAEIPALNGNYEKQLVTPTNLISGHELPIVMGLPKKSVPGLAVVEMAEFGRAVVYENKEPERVVEFGSIYHMGNVEHTRIKMDLDLLASHCFITGSSGSGKSYATYQLLHSVLQNDVKIMVIEPAKGEYKQIFGGLRGIKIFTTDPNTYRVLRINPFQFHESIHILSHIEQLLQIFNASWPLYAAMPAILKEAVVRSYVSCGWDVQNSIWIPGIGSHKYPVFADILECLPDIINHSEYSSDSKGDYKGALLTRVQSMTVGINALIFKNSEGIEDSILFDSNVVIDLSELGSDEAIALIMGVLIMKLNEYRKAQRKTGVGHTINSSLRHVTVLEEAHNILKRTSKEQSQDGANMVGKSVEMISNSIKEMRTYGEGFIIIDQSPMAVDTSAIENTATKIIMNTPAKDACIELGSALSLNDMQVGELSRLNVGVAAVFQKGWLSPVLMKVDPWDSRYEAEVQSTDLEELRIVKGKLITLLIQQRLQKKISPMKLKAITRASALTSDKKREIDEIVLLYNEKLFIGQKFNRTMFGRLLLELLNCEALFYIIPLGDMPTYQIYKQYDVHSHEFKQLKADMKNEAGRWMQSMMEAISLYASMDAGIKLEAIVDMLYVQGGAGKIKYLQNDQYAMLYRTICKILKRSPQ